MLSPHKKAQYTVLTSEHIDDAVEAINHCASDIVDEPAKSRLRYVARALVNLRNREIGAIVRDKPFFEPKEK